LHTTSSPGGDAILIRLDAPSPAGYSRGSPPTGCERSYDEGVAEIFSSFRVEDADAYALVFDVDEDALWSEVVAHMRAEQIRFGAIPVEELATPPEPQLRALEEPVELRDYCLG